MRLYSRARLSIYTYKPVLLRYLITRWNVEHGTSLFWGDGDAAAHVRLSVVVARLEPSRSSVSNPPQNKKKKILRNRKVHPELVSLAMLSSFKFNRHIYAWRIRAATRRRHVSEEAWIKSRIRKKNKKNWRYNRVPREKQKKWWRRSERTGSFRRDEFDEFGIFYTTVNEEKTRREKERERGWVRRVDWVIHERKRLISECCVYTLLESIAPY